MSRLSTRTKTRTAVPSRVTAQAWLAAALCVGLLASGCSFRQRTHDAEAIAGALARLKEAAAVLGSMSVTFRVEDLPDHIEFPASLGTETTYALPVRIDAARSAAQVFALEAVAAPGGARAPATPARLRTEIRSVSQYDDLDITVRRFQTSRVDKRRYAHIDLGEEEPPGRPGVREFVQLGGGPDLLNPAHVLDLLAGVLTGSVKNLGPAILRELDLGSLQATKHATTRYKLRVSTDKTRSELGLDTEQWKPRQSVLDLMAITGDVNDASVWLDDDGALRRFRVRFRQAPARRFLFSTTVDVRLRRGLDTSVAKLFPRVAEPATDDVVSLSNAAAVRDLLTGARAQGVELLRAAEQLAEQFAAKLDPLALVALAQLSAPANPGAPQR